MSRSSSQTANIFRDNWKEFATTTAKGTALCAIIGVFVGAATALNKLHQKVQLQEQLTSNQSVKLTALQQDVGFCDRLSHLTAFRSVDPVAYDTMLFNAEQILQIQMRTQQYMNNPAVFLEDLPTKAQDCFVQMNRALRVLDEKIERDSGFLTRQFRNAAAEILTYSRSMIENIIADVKERPARPELV